MNTPFWYQLNAFFVKTGLIREDDNDAGQYLYTIPDVNKRWKKNIPPLQSYYFFFTSYCSCNPNYPKDICWDCEVSNRKKYNTIEHHYRVLHHIRLLRVLGELKVRLCLSEQCLDEISLPVNLFPNKDWDVESQSSYPIFQLYFTYLCSINNNHFYNYI